MSESLKKYDVVIIGAGAAGLMCAIEAGKRNRNVLVLDHKEKPGKKILISGGGRCNFTNYDISSENYISNNTHFCKSALKRYTQWDFISMVDSYNIKYHERSHGQLFCDDSARDLVYMLSSECEKANVIFQFNTEINSISKSEDESFKLITSNGDIASESLVIATGGLSIPPIGASAFGYDIAKQFGLNVFPQQAGLVAFTLSEKDKKVFSELSGIAIDSVVTNSKISFRENVLFTHRGLSGPAILQISSYWNAGESISINLLPDLDILDFLTLQKRNNRDKKIKTVLAEVLPKRVIEILLPILLLDLTLKSANESNFTSIKNTLQAWEIKPGGTQGYRTAEVTLGGVDCNELSSKTMEVRNIKGLYFIGEVLDITGWLGGYNIQWAWSSGWCAGQYT